MRCPSCDHLAEVHPRTTDPHSSTCDGCEHDGHAEDMRCRLAREQLEDRPLAITKGAA